MAVRFALLGATLAGVGVVALTAGPLDVGEISRKEAAIIAQSLAAKLGGPVALVEPARARVDRDGKMICGWVQREGDADRGVSAMPFIGLLSSDGFGIAGLGDNRNRQAAVFDACNVRNLRL